MQAPPDRCAAIVSAVQTYFSCLLAWQRRQPGNSPRFVANLFAAIDAAALAVFTFTEDKDGGRE